MQLDDDVRGALSRATVRGRDLRLADQLPPKVYAKVKKALLVMGGRWNRTTGNHEFEDNAEDVVADAIATGTVLDFRKVFQFYETPTNVARELVEIALDGRGTTPLDTFLEPSAGLGRIIEAIRAKDYEPAACELMEKNRVALRAMGVKLIADDFLTLRPQSSPSIIETTLAPERYELAEAHQFDRIVANPPFTRGQDIMHVAHMYRCLAPGGRLVSIMSPAWDFARTAKHQAFRAFVEQIGHDWWPLPDGTFRESGTNVSAGIMVIDKARE